VLFQPNGRELVEDRITFFRVDLWCRWLPVTGCDGRDGLGKLSSASGRFQPSSSSPIRMVIRSPRQRTRIE